MSEERKPVKCPWCGGEMHGMVEHYHAVFCACYQCYSCGAQSAPIGKTTYQDAIDSAYEAATCRPPNKPLTQDEARALEPHTPIYAQFRDGDVITGPYAIGDALPRGEWPEYGKTVRWWTAWPSEELCKATEWDGQQP